MKELSQLDLVRCRYGNRTIELWRLDQRVVDLTVEFVFAYGTFGFGYANIFRWKSLRPPRDLVYRKLLAISGLCPQKSDHLTVNFSVLYLYSPDQREPVAMKKNKS